METEEKSEKAEQSTETIKAQLSNTMTALWMAVGTLLCVCAITTYFCIRAYRDMVKMSQDSKQMVAFSEKCVHQLETDKQEFEALAKQAEKTVKIAENCTTSLAQCVESRRDDIAATEKITEDLRSQTALMTTLATCREDYAYDMKRATLAIHQAKESLEDCYAENDKLQKRLLAPCPGAGLGAH